jgi:hypothetical protein
MTNPTKWARLRAVVGGMLVLALMIFVLADSSLGWFGALALGGGVLMAGLMFWTKHRSGRRQALAVPDVFARDRGTFDVINVNHIRVAGFGGAGMMLVALAMAWTFPRIGWSTAVGLIGGVVMAVAVILVRRRRGPLESGHGAEGGRGVLFDSDDPEETPVTSTSHDDRRPHRVGVVRT